MATSKHILSSNAFWTLNKKLTKEIGSIQAALFLTYLIDKESYHREKGTLIHIAGEDGEWFYAVSAKVKEATTLTYRQQKTCIGILKGRDLIDTRLVSVPAKLHFTLRHSLILQIVTSSIDKSAKLDLTYSQNIILRTYNEEQKEKNKEEEQIDAVLSIFKEVTRKNITTDGVRSRSNREAVRKILRLKEKPSIEEIKKVIELKYFEWEWNPEMSKFLQISTIFRKSNFLKYLEQLKTIESSPEERTKFINSVKSEKNGTAKGKEPIRINKGAGVGETSDYGF